MNKIKLFLIYFILFVLFYNHGEGQLNLPAGWSVSASEASRVSLYNFDGIMSYRFELDLNDRLVDGGKRSEIATPKEKIGVERWYRFNIFLPGEFHIDSLPEIVAQWHAIPDFKMGETWRSPPIALYIKNGRWALNILWAEDSVNTNKSITGQQKVDLGGCKYNRWVSWMFHIKFSHLGNGVLEVFKDGNVMLKRYGPNYYNDIYGPYFKFGIYKWMWNVPQKISPYISKRVLYFCHVKILDKAPKDIVF